MLSPFLDASSVNKKKTRINPANACLAETLQPILLIIMSVVIPSNIPADPPVESYHERGLRHQKEQNQFNALRREDRAAEVNIKRLEVDLQEKELDVESRRMLLKRKAFEDKHDLLQVAYEEYKKFRAHDAENDGGDHGTVESHLAFKYRDMIEGA